MEHAPRTTDIPVTATEREEPGKQGGNQIIVIDKRMRRAAAMTALRAQDSYTQEYIVPKFGLNK